MENPLLDFWKKNKKIIVQAGGAVLGGLIGVGLTMLILSGEEEVLAEDWIETNEFEGT